MSSYFLCDHDWKATGDHYTPAKQTTKSQSSLGHWMPDDWPLAHAETFNFTTSPGHINGKQFCLCHNVDTRLLTWSNTLVLCIHFMVKPCKDVSKDLLVLVHCVSCRGTCVSDSFCGCFGMLLSLTENPIYHQKISLCYSCRLLSFCKPIMSVLEEIPATKKRSTCRFIHWFSTS